MRAPYRMWIGVLVGSVSPISRGMRAPYSMWIGVWVGSVSPISRGTRAPYSMWIGVWVGSVSPISRGMRVQQTILEMSVLRRHVFRDVPVLVLVLLPIPVLVSRLNIFRVRVGVIMQRRVRVSQDACVYDFLMMRNDMV